MRIERINENRIKVIIEADEAMANNLTVKDITDNTQVAQKMFWQVLRLAEENINFSVGSAKLFVETIPSCEEGIGMVITKVCTEEDIDKAVKNCFYKGRIKRSELKPLNSSDGRQRKYIFRFESFDAVCSGAGQLEKGYFGISTLYKYDGYFYLYLIPDDPISLCEADTVLSEFAVKQKNGQYFHGRLNEYGKVMIENNAVEVLSEYFCKC